MKRRKKNERKIFVQMSKSTQDPLSYDTDLLNFVSYGNPIYIRFYYIKTNTEMPIIFYICVLILSETFISLFGKITKNDESYQRVYV